MNHNLSNGLRSPKALQSSSSFDREGNFSSPHRSSSGFSSVSPISPFIGSSNDVVRNFNSRSKNKGRSVRHVYEDGFEFDPLSSPHSPQKTQKYDRTSSLTSSESSTTTANESDRDYSWTLNNTAALHNSEINSKQRISSNHNAVEREKLSEVGQLASLFLEVKKGILSTNHIEIPEKVEYNNKTLKSVSRQTLHRAEKVKMMINLYYFALFQNQNQTNPQYKGIDGVYNPLQIIRNRKIRKKYHQVPQLSVKTIPAASTAFSSKKSKLIWEIDLAELAHDATWRTQHWHELINARGELWFPDPKAEHRHKHHRHSHNFRHRHGSFRSEGMENLHGKLFDDENDADETSEDNELSSRYHPKERKRDRLAKKVRSKSPYKKVKNSSSDLLSHFLDDKHNDSQLLSTDIDSESLSRAKILNDISIEPLKPPERSTTGTQSGDSSGISENAIEDLDHRKDRLFNKYFERLNYLNGIAQLNQHSDEYNKLKYQSLNFNILDKYIAEIESNCRLLQDDALVGYESLLKEKTNELSEIQNELASEFSTRVDRMLTLSDRTIGEVNTTLSLELRKLTERFEKSTSAHRKRDSMVNFGYWLLENLVVLTLWCIWVGFSIGRCLKFFLLLIWRVFKWIFY